MHSMLDLELATMLHRERLGLAQARRDARRGGPRATRRLPGVRWLLAAFHVGRRAASAAITGRKAAGTAVGPQPVGRTAVGSPAVGSAAVGECGPLGCAA